MIKYILKKIIGLENDKPIDILNYIKRIIFVSNAYITYRIMLTIPVLVSAIKAKNNKNLFKINSVSVKI